MNPRHIAVRRFTGRGSFLMTARVLERVGIGLAALAAVATAWLWLIISDLPDALTDDQTRPVGVLIGNVHLVSMVPGEPEVEDARTVLVMGDRIVEVGPAGGLPAP